MQRIRIMGILNVTPDSFHSESRTPALDATLERARRLLQEGADILDVGGESTRPGAQALSASEELKRIVPVFAALASEFPDLPLSVDTYKAEVARVALEAGASLVNDVSGGRLDAAMPGVVASTGATVIVGHMRGTPKTMQQAPHFHDVVAEVAAELAESVLAFSRAGVAKERLWVDPGFGFGKRLEDNVALLAGLGELRGSGAALVVGISRKRFIGLLCGGAAVEDPAARLHGSLAAQLLAVLRGADVVRTHDVGATREVLAVAAAVFGFESRR